MVRVPGGGGSSSLRHYDVLRTKLVCGSPLNGISKPLTMLWKLKLQSWLRILVLKLWIFCFDLSRKCSSLYNKRFSSSTWLNSDKNMSYAVKSLWRILKVMLNIQPSIVFFSGFYWNQGFESRWMSVGLVCYIKTIIFSISLFITWTERLIISCWLMHGVWYMALSRMFFSDIELPWRGQSLVNYFLVLLWLWHIKWIR